MPTSSKAEFYALVRFLASLFVLAMLAVVDLLLPESIPYVVYGSIGILNGVDLYNLIKVKKEA